MLESILWITLAHFIADFPMQGDFLASTKGSNWYSLFAHSTIYGLSIALCFKLLGVFAIWKVIALVVSHILIDRTKARAKDKSKALTAYLYLDQTAHMAINFVLLIF